MVDKHWHLKFHPDKASIGMTRMYGKRKGLWGYLSLNNEPMKFH